MSKFKAVYGDPAPNTRTLYPFAEMQVGQSFFVPTKNVLQAKSVRAAAHSYKLRHPGWNYTSRQQPDPHLGSGIRVWRI